MFRAPCTVPGPPSTLHKYQLPPCNLDEDRDADLPMPCGTRALSGPLRTMLWLWLTCGKWGAGAGPDSNQEPLQSENHVTLL